MKKTLAIISVAFPLFLTSCVETRPTDSVSSLNKTSSELKCDDGTMEVYSSPYSNNIGSEIAVRFTPQFYPASLKKVKVYISSRGEPSTQFSIKIYEDDNGNYPGSQLNTKDIYGKAQTGNEWIEIDVSSQQLTILEGDFFVSMYWLKAPGLKGKNAQLIGSDFNGSLCKNSYFKWGGSNDWSSRFDRNIMIRAIIDHVGK